MSEVTVYDEYQRLIKHLKTLYGCTFEKVDDFIHVCVEGKYEAFRLMFGTFADVRGDAIVLSFHLQVDPALAIQWFVRMQHIYPLIRVAECYFKDDDGKIHMGKDARLIKHYKDEQTILSNYAGSKEDAEEYSVHKVVGKAKNESKPYASKQQATKEFMEDLVPGDEEVH